jgi:uncharacterized membrane protein
MTQTRTGNPQSQQSLEMSSPLLIEEHTTVRAPIDQVYAVWRDVTRFPEFMANVEEVQPLEGNRSHWVARIFGVKQEWEAEMTDTTPNERVSWHSISGAPNAGTVTFHERAPGITDVQVALEYTPPAGDVGKTLDKLTKTTQREVKEDLRNFKRLVSAPGADSLSASFLAPDQDAVELGAVAASLAGPISGAVVGGLLAYAAHPASAPLSWTRPASWVTASAQRTAQWRAGAYQSLFTSARPVSKPAGLVSWAMSGAALASVATSAALRLTNRKQNALFVGQWAPTFLGWSLLTRLQGHRGVRHDRGASIASWSVLGASLGSVAASAVHHLRGKRKDGLFVGQWAPTLMIGASLVRLFNR